MDHGVLRDAYDLTQATGSFRCPYTLLNNEYARVELDVFVSVRPVEYADQFRRHRTSGMSQQALIAGSRRRPSTMSRARFAQIPGGHSNRAFKERRVASLRGGFYPATLGISRSDRGCVAPTSLTLPSILGRPSRMSNSHRMQPSARASTRRRHLRRGRGEVTPQRSGLSARLRGSGPRQREPPPLHGGGGDGGPRGGVCRCAKEEEDARGRGRKSALRAVASSEAGPRRH